MTNEVLPEYPILDVVLVTYNHIRFIRDALDGVIQQMTAFPWRVLVADDCSTDGTQEILKEYADKYPDLITLFFSSGNIGIKGPEESYVWSVIRRHSNAKYLHLLEGDDYWTDPLKLQKQVNFLEAHPEYSLCCHKYVEISDSRDISVESTGIFDGDVSDCKDITIANHLAPWVTHTCTVMFRRQALRLSELRQYKYLRDNHIVYHLLKWGPGVRLSFMGSVYRRHQSGYDSMVPIMKRSYSLYEVFEEIGRINNDNQYREMALFEYEAFMKCLISSSGGLRKSIARQLLALKEDILQKGDYAFAIRRLLCCPIGWEVREILARISNRYWWGACIRKIPCLGRWWALYRDSLKHSDD